MMSGSTLFDRVVCGVDLSDAGISAARVAEYGNFVPVERSDGAAGMHAAEAYERLRAIKREWDPQNLFARNHNIAP
jgi:FAD/FMN-containing dehydrogenase